MAEFTLSENPSLIGQLTNDLKLIKDTHPVLFNTSPNTVEIPKKGFRLLVQEQLAMSTQQQNTEYDLQLLNNQVENSPEVLPIDEFRDEIASTIRESKYTIIAGGLGAGKSTRVPQIIRQDQIRQEKGFVCNIICTQPKRHGAVSVAERVASELGEKIGESVGYTIHGDIRLSSFAGGAKIKYCTTGVLLRTLVCNPALPGVSHVILDEVHEGYMDIEILLRFLKELAELRSDFKLIVMSGTMDTDLYENYFNCQVINIGYDTRFNVETYYLDDIEFLREDVTFEDITFEDILNEREKRYSAIFKVVEHIVQRTLHGAILIFVVGSWDMDELQKLFSVYNNFQRDPQRRLIVKRLRARVACGDRNILGPLKGPGRKVILSATIAETITIPDAKFVIDTGLVYAPSFDPECNTEEWQVSKTTKASTEQRRGRVGRTSPGVCYRLYNRDDLRSFPDERDYHDMRNVILNILCLGESVDIFDSFVHIPMASHWANELENLQRYQMIGENNQLTILGQRVCELHALHWSDPLVAKMMIWGSIFGCGEVVSGVCAGVSFIRCNYIIPDHDDRIEMDYQTLYKTLGRNLPPTSDALLILDLIQKYTNSDDEAEFCRTFSLNQMGVEEVFLDKTTIDAKMTDQRGAAQRKMSLVCLENIVASAYLPNVLFRKMGGFYRPMYPGAILGVHPKSVLNTINWEDDQLFTYNKISGGKIEFLNKISPEAVIIFSNDVELVSSTQVVVDKCMTFTGSASKIELLHSLRAAWQGVLTIHLERPTAFTWNDPQGQILDVIIRLLSDV